MDFEIVKVSTNITTSSTIRRVLEDLLQKYSALYSACIVPTFPDTFRTIVKEIIERHFNDGAAKQLSWYSVTLEPIDYFYQ